MKLFHRYVPSVEEEKREKADRTRHIGVELFALAVLLAIVCVGILCGGHGGYSYDYYPHMRTFDVVTSCLGLAWAAVLSLFYFLMKPTRRKLKALYVLDALSVALFFAYLFTRTYLAETVRFPNIPITFSYFLPDIFRGSLFLLYFPLFHLIYYRKSKVLLD